MGHPSVADALSRANFLAARGQYLDALALVDSGLAVESTNSDLHHGRGFCLKHLQRWTDAAQAFDKAVEFNEGNTSARIHLALLSAREGNLDEAYTMAKEIQAPEKSDDTHASFSVQINEALGLICTELGLRYSEKGDRTRAMEYFEEARQVRFAPAAFHLGVLYSQRGDYARAKEMYVEATTLNPQYVEAWNNLGVTLRRLNNYAWSSEGESACRNAYALNQCCVKSRENLAVMLVDHAVKLINAGDLKGGKAKLKEAQSIHAVHGDTFFNLGVLYGLQNKRVKAKIHYEIALHFAPSHAMCANNLAVLCRQMGRLEEAAMIFEKALAIEPRMSLANKNYGALCGSLGRMDEAFLHTQRAIEANPHDCEAYNNLALLHRDAGDVETCVRTLNKCAELLPEDHHHHVHSNLLMTLNYTDQPREVIFEKHLAWARRFEPIRTPKKCKSETPSKRRTRDPSSQSTTASGGSSSSRSSSPERKLRVGYVSPDMYYHSVSYFSQAALQFPSAVEVFVYSDAVHEDAKTRLFRSYPNTWRVTLGKTHEEVAAIIRSDNIDILVDLAGHTGYNRLPMFALKPAKVQITWIGYPNTTGLTAMDYRITDAICDPTNVDAFCSERLLRLPCFLCYTPNADGTDGAAPPPIRDCQGGQLTFGCFNTLPKINAATLKIWCQVLDRVPDARLFLKSKALASDQVCARIRGLFGPKYAHRLELSGLLRSPAEHLAQYSCVDIALDTFPYCGTTTTCEALYMGVPTVTCRSQAPGMHAQNVSSSILTAIGGLDDLICNSPEEYVDACVQLAENADRRAYLRKHMREKMLASPLCDGKAFCEQLEKLYLQIAR